MMGKRVIHVGHDFPSSCVEWFGVVRVPDYCVPPPKSSNPAKSTSRETGKYVEAHLLLLVRVTVVVRVAVAVAVAVAAPSCALAHGTVMVMVMVMVMVIVMVMVMRVAVSCPMSSHLLLHLPRMARVLVGGVEQLLL